MSKTMTLQDRLTQLATQLSQAILEDKEGVDLDTPFRKSASQDLLALLPKKIKQPSYEKLSTTEANAIYWKNQGHNNVIRKMEKAIKEYCGVEG